MITLEIIGLKIQTHIGVHNWEQKIKQTLLIDLILKIENKDFKENIEKTLNYAELCDLVTKFVESKSFQLIETVAQEVFNKIETEFRPSILKIKVSKPHAVKNAQNVAVTLEK